ncbi:MAG: DUF2095 domain-containing protein [Promethearchaeota archaeon]|nr:MAG: DUF2095 domain-containing protein [Candidatus Lokiarchaeota archaeon]
MEKKSDNNNKFEKAKINRKKGLNISYDKEEINNFLPHLLEEIKGKKESVKIDAVDYEVEKHGPKGQEREKDNEKQLKALKNPTAIDFIRRCSTKVEAIEILDYLLKRGEISKKELNSIKKKLKKENGLKDLIEKNGGFKRPGYYMRKFYYDNNRSKNKSRSQKELD